MKVFTTPSDAYLGALQDVYFEPDVKSAPRNQPVREKLDYSFRVLEPNDNPIETKDTERNGVIRSYTAKEVELYNSCTNLAADFGAASKFWLSLSNPDGTVNSAYGHLIWAKRSHGSDYEGRKNVKMYDGKDAIQTLEPEQYLRTPWDYAKECLLLDKDTRQAIMRFSLPEHAWIGNKDQVCTLHGNFLIRNDKLHFSVVMRSNDLMLGLVFDLPWFCSLMDRMIKELKPMYPNLVKGHYTHTVHSLHIYEKDEPKIRKMLGLCEKENAT
jgi:thymidylate synthase